MEGGREAGWQGGRVAGRQGGRLAGWQAGCDCLTLLWTPLPTCDWFWLTVPCSDEMPPSCEVRLRADTFNEVADTEEEELPDDVFLLVAARSSCTAAVWM